MLVGFKLPWLFALSLVVTSTTSSASITATTFEVAVTSVDVRTCEGKSTVKESSYAHSSLLSCRSS